MNIRSLTVLVVICSIIIASAATYTYAAGAEVVYKHYCTQCHGLKGDGKGPNAAQLTVAPRNHTDPKEMGKLSDKDIVTAILEGGGAVGKSTAMPAWGKTISNDDANDLVKHLRKLCNCTGPK
jgi:cytochrome c oxidase cbb3-type subunit 3